MVNDKQTILIDRQGRVGLITLNRPDYLNAVNSTMGLEIREQIEKFNEDDSGAFNEEDAGARSSLMGGETLYSKL